MREIALSNGGYAFVDDDAPPVLFKMAWCSLPYKGTHYARARFPKKLGGHGRVVFMHRFIMEAPVGLVVDHINGNGLDNQRANLQITTYSRNNMRSVVRRGGVTKMHDADRWRARLRVDGRMVSLGCYDTKEEAQAAIDAARKVIWEDPDINLMGTTL